jgi:predicted Zn-dependent protease
MNLRFLAVFAVAATALAQNPSPAEQKIASARRAIELRPQFAQGYVELASALIARARETSRPTYFDEAGEALKQALRIDPSNYPAQKLDVAVLLGKHEFAGALEKATALNKRVPDDVFVWGLLTDVYIALGNYAEAEKAAQWMLNLRPGNLPALIHASCLRELFGEIGGAIDAMNAAYAATPPTETEERAWMLSQVGHMEWTRGRLAEAGKDLEKALALFPDYPIALAHLAEVRTAEKRYSEAVSLLDRCYRSEPSPATLYALAEALEKAGRIAESQRAFADFERDARARMNAADNSNRELVLFYAGHAAKPAEALRIAKMEAAKRRDVLTLDAYAWALQASGNNAEARKVIEGALEVGVQDPGILLHAAVIAQKQTATGAAASISRRSVIER